jgi:hypothetical protein
VTALRRWAALPHVLISAVALAVVVAGCGSGAPATSTPGASAGRSPLVAPSGAPRASLAAGATATLPTTTDTEFGKIFDALPSTFPTLTGQEPADPGAGPTSGSFAVNMTVTNARKLMEVQLIAQGWTVVVGSPLEDGSVVLEATGGKATCKTEVRFTPTSGTVIMSVLYGASCPFS